MDMLPAIEKSAASDEQRKAEMDHAVVPRRGFLDELLTEDFLPALFAQVTVLILKNDIHFHIFLQTPLCARIDRKKSRIRANRLLCTAADFLSFQMIL